MSVLERYLALTDEQYERVVPDGASWHITDDTGAMWELKFDDSGVSRMIYKAQYEGICVLWELSDKAGRMEIAEFLRAWR